MPWGEMYCMRIEDGFANGKAFNGNMTQHLSHVFVFVFVFLFVFVFVS